jgi:hypothetical protein
MTYKELTEVDVSVINSIKSLGSKNSTTVFTFATFVSQYIHNVEMYKREQAKPLGGDDAKRKMYARSLSGNKATVMRYLEIYKDMGCTMYSTVSFDS